MFVNIGLEVKKSSSSKSAVAGNFTPKPNNHKLLNSMSWNPKNNVRFLQVLAGNPWSLLKTLETLECSSPSLLSFCVGSTREFWLTQSQNWRNSSSTSGHTPSSSDSWTKSFGQKIGKSLLSLQAILQLPQYHLERGRKIFILVRMCVEFFLWSITKASHVGLDFDWSFNKSFEIWNPQPGETISDCDLLEYYTSLTKNLHKKSEHISSFRHYVN